MDVFDSNVWIYGITRTCYEATELVDRVVENPYHVAISAYIYDEVLENIQAADQPQEVLDEALTDFSTMVHGNHTIHGPTRQEIREMDVEALRRTAQVQAMSEMTGVEPKDVPVLSFGYDIAHGSDAEETTIHTADRPFSRFDPSEFFSGIVINYIDCSGR